MNSLGGRTVVPGFNDAHDHIAPAFVGTEFTTVADPVPDPSFAQVRDSLRAAAARTPEGTWLKTTVGAAVLFDPAARRAALDAVAPNHPVQLHAWSGHGIILNSRGLAAVGLSDTAADPLAARLERDASGRLTGLLEEYAGYGLWTRLAPSGDSALVAAFQARAAEAVQWGITSIQDKANGMPPDGIAQGR